MRNIQMYLIDSYFYESLKHLAIVVHDISEEVCKLSDSGPGQARLEKVVTFV